MAFEIPGAVDMSQQSVLTNNFKIAIVAGQGEGKSWLAASCATKDEPAFHFDFDGRKQSIAGKPFVTSKTYLDIGFPNLMPKGWQTFQQDLAAMERAHAKGELPFKWGIYDSATYGSIACLNHIMYNTPSMRKSIVAGGITTYIPAGFDAYKAEMAEVTQSILRLSAIMNLIVCFHIGMEKGDNSTLEKPVFTGKFSCIPPRYGDLLALFNDVWRVKAKGPGQYEVQTQPSYDFTAKNTMLLDATEKPNVREMMAKYMTKAKAGGAK